jgi:hypothetical protein
MLCEKLILLQDLLLHFCTTQSVQSYSFSAQLLSNFGRYQKWQNMSNDNTCPTGNPALPLKA